MGDHGVKTYSILSTCCLVGLFRIADIRKGSGIELAVHRVIRKLEATHLSNR